MEDFFLEQIYNFVDDFSKLLNDDNYISKKQTDSLLDKYSDITKLFYKYPKYDDAKYKKASIILNNAYKMVRIRNEQYIAKKLRQEEKYFDEMFKDIDSNIVLDEEQRRAILIDEDYSLIIAGAGSGKTTTMVAKVKYLIEKKKVNPTNIILLSYTNMSVDDLNRQLNTQFHLNVEALTFHKLGRRVLNSTSAVPFQIIDDGGIYHLLCEYFLEKVFTNKSVLKKYTKYFSKYLVLDDYCMNYSSYDDYYKHYMDLKYDACKENLKEEIKKRINNRTASHKTINGESVKSDGEVKIANYLYTHGINYGYEKTYPYLCRKPYKPDFTIENDDMPIFVEYYGPTILKNNGTWQSYNEQYQKTIELKRNTHNVNNTDLVELYGRYEDKRYFLEELSKELDKRNIVKRKRSEKEIFYRLLETSKSYKYAGLIRLLLNCINLFKEKRYTKDEFRKIIENCSNDTLKNQLVLFKDAYSYYEQKRKELNRIDFNDMIYGAYENVEKFKEYRKRLKYDYIIIDEYQDISYQRYRLAKKISDLFSAKIVAVGDDWQTIYSFSGSNIDLFTKFDEAMGYSEEIQITNTYRNSQELIDLAGEFILQNDFQISKKLHSNKHIEKPVKLVQYNYGETEFDLPSKLEELLKKIYSLNPNDNILLLVRFGFELELLLQSKLFYKNRLDDSKIICKAIPDAKIDILTVHKSKGLGYDRVIILNGLDSKYGFPSQISDEVLVKYLRGDYDDRNEFKELIEYPEERRLFYVAMTRTKNELYIMIPTSYKYRSDFIKEIECNENVVLNY